jgi:hypothetical protein
VRIDVSVPRLSLVGTDRLSDLILNSVLSQIARRSGSQPEGRRFRSCPRYEENPWHSYMCRGFSRVAGWRESGYARF